MHKFILSLIYDLNTITSEYSREIQSGDDRKTEFCFGYSYFEHQVMSFGVMNRPVTFQDCINSILQDYLDILFTAFFDDILINFLDPKTDKDDVCYVLKPLLKHGSFDNLSDVYGEIFKSGS